MGFLQNVADRLLVRFARGGQYESETLRKRFRERYDIHIGLYSIGGFDRWRIPPGTRIGRYCSIANAARLVEADHPIDSLTTHPYLYLPEFGVVAEHGVDSRPQVLEDDVWLGHNATVLPGCRIVGRGAVIGAGSVVMSDVPRYAVMSGFPAKLIRYRFAPVVRAAIEATQWWELDKQALARGLKAAPGFGTHPDAASARVFYRAVHGKELDFDESSFADERIALPKLPREQVAALFRQEMPGFGEKDFATPIDKLAIDSFALINLRIALEAANGFQIHDSAWGALARAEDLVGEPGAARAPAQAAALAKPPAPQLAPLLAPGAAKGAAREMFPTSELRRYSLNMPQMALKGMSESWLFKELGDIHWSVLLRALGANSASLTDAAGDRLYATFTRIHLKMTGPLADYRENDDLVISMSEARYGAAMFFGTAKIQGPRAQGTAELMTTFSKYGEAGVNTSLLKGQPTIPPDCQIPLFSTLPEFGMEYRARRAEALAPALFETEYELLPPHDINGVGLLYFAAYPTIAEICVQRYAGLEFAFNYSTAERDICYFANAEPSEIMVFRLHRWEKTDERIVYEGSISRKSDNKVMAAVIATKLAIAKSV